MSDVFRKRKVYFTNAAVVETDLIVWCFDESAAEEYANMLAQAFIKSYQLRNFGNDFTIEEE